jgi:hypothetical protein
MKSFIIVVFTLLLLLTIAAQQGTKTATSNDQEKTGQSSRSPRDERIDPKEQKEQIRSKIKNDGKQFLSLGSMACPPDSDAECREKERSINQEDQMRQEQRRLLM